MTSKNSLPWKKYEYVLTVKEVGTILNRSDKTISRYIKSGLLHPLISFKETGGKRYMFSKVDVDNFVDSNKYPMTKKTTEKPACIEDLNIILKQQVKIKDEQIKDMSKQLKDANIRNNKLTGLVNMFMKKVKITDKTKKKSFALWSKTRHGIDKIL